MWLGRTQFVAPTGSPLKFWDNGYNHSSVLLPNHQIIELSCYPSLIKSWQWKIHINPPSIDDVTIETY